jgi:hypothetical protein
MRQKAEGCGVNTDTADKRCFIPLVCAVRAVLHDERENNIPQQVKAHGANTPVGLSLESIILRIMKKLFILALTSALTLTGCAGQHITGDGHVKDTSPVPYEVDKTGNHDAGTALQQQQESTFNGRSVD